MIYMCKQLFVNIKLLCLLMACKKTEVKEGKDRKISRMEPSHEAGMKN